MSYPSWHNPFWPERPIASVRSLYIEMRFDGQRLASGTGFVVETRTGPALITNRHNLRGRNNKTGQPLSSTGGIPNEVMILHHRSEELGYWVERVEKLYPEGSDSSTEDRRWIEHPVYGEKMDLVALPLAQLERIQLYPWRPGLPPESCYHLVLDRSTALPNIPHPADGDFPIDVRPADAVSVIGFPFGERMHWTPNEVDDRFPPGPLKKYEPLRDKLKALNEELEAVRYELGISVEGQLPETLDQKFTKAFRDLNRRFHELSAEYQDIPSMKGGLPVWATGFIASEPNLDLGGMPLLLIDCRTRRGQSGSPVIACRNPGTVRLVSANQREVQLATSAYRFIGVYSGRINSESDLGYVWKASAVRDLVAVMGGEPLPERWAPQQP